MYTVTGCERKRIAETVYEARKAPTNVYLEKLSTMNEPELLAGNVTACHNPQVIKQAGYQLKKSSYLSDDPIYELKVAKKSLRAAIGNELRGYIQDVALSPFSVTFYMEEQVQALVRTCGRGNDTVLHLDATGSIMSRIPQEGTPYYYCLLLADLNLPVLEFLSTTHNAFRICAALQQFISQCRAISPSCIIQPSVVVTDFSLAMIYAVIEAFNKMSLISYLSCTFEILKGMATEMEITSLTFVALCCAHMVKTISRRLVRCESRKKVREVAMVMFARLQRCSGLVDGLRIYRSIYLLLNSRHCTAEVEASRLEILPPLEDQLYNEMAQIDVNSSQTLLANETQTAKKRESESRNSESEGMYFPSSVQPNYKWNLLICYVSSV